MDVNQATIERIRELCWERGLTTNGLSYLCGVSQSTVNSILKGQSQSPKVVTIKKLCDGLDITLAQFFDTDMFNRLEQEIK